MKPDLSQLTGEQLFDYYTGIEGEYKQTLFQAYTEIGNELFELLEKAEKEGKKVVIKEDIPDVNDSPVTVTIE